MLINLSNHPSNNWKSTQIEEGKKFGEIMDIPFPEILPLYSTQEVMDLAKVYLQKILTIRDNYKEEVIVHVMGEISFCYMLVGLLHENNIRCVVSTTKRIIKEISSSEKKVVFEFQMFRNYKE